MRLNNVLSKMIIFAVGAAIGSAATLVFVKNKYKKLAKEEIEEVREFYKEKHKKSIYNESGSVKEYSDIDEESDHTDESMTHYKKYESMLKNNEYKTDEEEDDDMDKFKVLSPEEYEECEYPTITLWYYNDGILTNDRGKIINNVDEVVGRGSLSTFGEYEEDSVFVVDNELKVVYEILKEYSNFLEND